MIAVCVSRTTSDVAYDTQTAINPPAGLRRSRTCRFHASDEVGPWAAPSSVTACGSVRLDVVVQAEEVGRIVSLLQCDETVEVSPRRCRGPSYRCPRTVPGIHVLGARCKRLQRAKRRPAAFEGCVVILRVFPVGLDAEQERRGPVPEGRVGGPGRLNAPPSQMCSVECREGLCSFGPRCSRRRWAGLQSPYQPCP